MKKRSSVTCLFGLTDDRSHVVFVVAVVVFDSSHYPCLVFFFHHMYYFPYFLTVNFFNYGRLPLITILRDEHVYPSCFYLTPGIGIQQRTRSVYVLRRINIYTPYRVMYILYYYIYYTGCACCLKWCRGRAFSA